MKMPVGHVTKERPKVGKTEDRNKSTVLESNLEKSGRDSQLY